MASDENYVVMDQGQYRLWSVEALCLQLLISEKSQRPCAACSPPPSHVVQGEIRLRALDWEGISRVLNEAAANHPSLSQCSSHLHINPICQNQNPEKKS